MIVSGFKRMCVLLFFVQLATPTPTFVCFICRKLRDLDSCNFGQGDVPIAVTHLEFCWKRDIVRTNCSHSSIQPADKHFLKVEVHENSAIQLILFLHFILHVCHAFMSKCPPRRHVHPGR